MRSWKKIAGIAIVILGIAVAAGTFISVAGQRMGDTTILRMAHNQSKGSEIADTIDKISDYAAEDEANKLSVNIYASGVLGTEKEEVEMVQAGILDMAKVSANTLGQFKDEYSIFAVPYLFESQEHYYNAMANSKAIQDLFNSTREDGYIAIGYYANGARNFYLKNNVACDNPSVLKGLKIRSMQSTTAMNMIEAMGGTPVPMSGGETYTALQQGIVDGAENTELALTVDGHEDLVKSYTYTEHQYTPDIYIISTKTWDSLTENQQNALVDAIRRANDNFVATYQRMMDDAIAEAEEHGVTVYRDIDKSAFIEAVQPIHESYCGKGDSYQKLYDDIQTYAE